MRRNPRGQGRHPGLRTLATVLVTAALVMGGGCGDDGGPAGTGPPVPTRDRDTTSISGDGAGPSSSATPDPFVPSPAPTSPAPPPPPAPPLLRQGDSGAAVAALQQRLGELGYWTGSPEGVFDAGTHHAVVAVQKTAGIGRDGVVGPATREALDAGTGPTARSTSGLVIEIDLEHQLLLVVREGHVDAVHDTSTGTVAGTTPVGRWTVTREIDGLRRSPLGLLYRPKYFYEGVAVHGYTSVPSTPASHGCVRVTYPAMDHLWATDAMPVGTPVWVY